jgi:DNA-binding CsgD family transcriptional regulator
MTTLIFEELDYVKVVAPSGDFRYGCIQQVEDDGWLIRVSFNDEGLNKIEYDAACGGVTAEDWSKELSPMEKKIIPLLALGSDAAEIAQKMTISPVTARGYIRLLRIKLGLDDRTQLIAFARGLNKSWEMTNERASGSHRIGKR